VFFPLFFFLAELTWRAPSLICHRVPHLYNMLFYFIWCSIPDISGTPLDLSDNGIWRVFCALQNKPMAPLFFFFVRGDHHQFNKKTINIQRFNPPSAPWNIQLFQEFSFFWPRVESAGARSSGMRIGSKMCSRDVAHFLIFLKKKKQLNKWILIWSTTCANIYQSGNKSIQILFFSRVCYFEYI
jgi:hypothetical protein